jgi:hypothetical protein
MTKLIKKEIQQNIDALALDPIIRALALETIRGEAEGIPIDINGIKFLNASLQQYVNRGGEIIPKVDGAVAEAIKKVRNQLAEITANKIREEQNNA